MQRVHRTAHALVWTILAIALPVCVAVIFVSTSRLSPDAPSIRLASPQRPEAGP